jgi:hypothetical protein
VAHHPNSDSSNRLIVDARFGQSRGAPATSRPAKVLQFQTQRERDEVRERCEAYRAWRRQQRAVEAMAAPRAE